MQENQNYLIDAEMAVVSEAGLSTEEMFGAGRGFFDEENINENYSYLNAATCPDCNGGMVRLGRCDSCPSCGFESCSL